MDAEERLKTIVKDTGMVRPVYGGFEIKVTKPTLFPWYKVFNLLIELGQEIWISNGEEKIHITSKPKV